MKRYIKSNDNQTLYPYTIQMLKADNPGTVFSKPLDKMNQDVLAAFDVFEVYILEASPSDSQNVNRHSVPSINNGLWELGFDLIDKSTEQVQSEIDSAKKPMIRLISDRHNIRKLTPVAVSVGGLELEFKGGLDSEGAIAKSEEFAIELGSPVVELWDMSNDLHNLTIEESRSVRIAIGMQYRTHYSEQKMTMKAVNESETVAEAQAALDAYLAL